MATFAELKQQVSLRLIDPNNESVSAASVGLAINDAIAYWKFRRFWFNEVRDTGTIAYQTSVIPLPSDFLVPTKDDAAFSINYSNLRYPLTKITAQQFDALFLTNGYGLPVWYARTKLDGGLEQYQVYPIADRDYEVLRDYLKNYVALSADSDTNDFTAYAPRLITLWSLANLSAELRQDDKMEAYYRRASQDEYRQLQVMSDKSNSSGSIAIHSALY
jgi:hypothetical protein